MLEGCTPWPPETMQRYRDRGYWRAQSLTDLPRKWSESFGRHDALVRGSTRITYADLDLRIDRMAAGFIRHGITAGDRVVLQLPNVPEFVIACFALFRIDAKPVFSLINHRSSEIRHLCELSGARGYIVPATYRGFDHVALAAEIMAEVPTLERVFVMEDPGTGERAGSARGGVVPLIDVDAEPASLPPPSTAASDVAFFLLSGGTTALPKLIPRTHDDYIYQTRATAELLQLSSNDVYLAALPIEFNFAWGCPGVIGTLQSGGTVVLVDEPYPADCFETIATERVTFTSLVPSLAQLWLEDADGAVDLPSLQVIQIGGARLHREIAEQIAPVFGCRLQQVFGMAEGLLTFTRPTDPMETVLSTQGRPLSPDDEIRVVNDAGDDVPPGCTGELLARGPYTLRGYYRADAHNARAFTTDGFYRTGDVVRLTEAGDLVVEGRIKDVINRGGSKVSAEEVEGHLLADPAVDRAAVVPIPDPYLGEAICAYVRPTGEAPTLLALRKALQARGIADFKLPDRLIIVSDLPLTGLGKIDKKALTSAAAEAANTSAN